MIFFARFLGGGSDVADWLAYGGHKTLASYGVPGHLITGNDLKALRDDVVQRMPQAHVAFLNALPLSVTFGDYFFVHAGGASHCPLAEQKEHDLLWIRGAFLDSAYLFEKKIVHGHTPVSAADFRDNRINLDTGAYGSNRLTAARFEHDQVMVIAP